MIATIRKGYRIVFSGTVYLVIGSSSLRGKYFYVVRREFDNAKMSILRARVLAGQQSGAITILASNSNH